MYLNNLLQQTNQSVVVAVAPTNMVRIIDPARPPSDPYKPLPFRNPLYGFSMGAALGVGIAFAHRALQHHQKSRKFSAPGHASNFLDVPELGVIPSTTVLEKRRGPSRFDWRKKKLADGAPLEGETQSQLSVFTNERHSLLADSFRLVVTSLNLMERQGQSWKVIAVTSPGPAEGKTTVLSNLAFTIAESQRRVLVIDGDLRKPQLHRTFGVQKKRGLSDLILGSDAADLTWKDVVVPTSVPGVSIMTAGSLIGSAAAFGKLMNSQHVLRLLMTLRNEFDTILIDTPPMLLFSEARNMSRLGDGVILVLRAGTTDRESARDCRKRLNEDGTRLLGTILNDWSPEENKGYYNSYYHYDTKQAEGK
jgi:capsular exopolysaccharide family